MQNAGMNDSSVDHRNIVALSQSCTEELEAKLREKAQLIKYIAELKKKKMAWDAKLTKKRKEVDTTLVQTIEMEKKLHVLNGSNKTVGAEVAGLRTATDRETQEVDRLKALVVQVSANCEREVAEVNRLKQILQGFRRDVAVEAKNRENIHQDLRATKTAQNLMLNRLDSMEKRNRALKNCVANTFNLS